MTQRLTDAARRDWLRLARTEGVGPVGFRELINRYGEASLAIAALPDLARRSGRASTPRTPSVTEAEAELARGGALGARLIAACEPDFPLGLAHIDPPPPLIWTLGDDSLLTRPAVAVVGARVASAAGQRFARELAADLGRAGFVVVSGLARGIDGAAHEAALGSGTIAVLGGGVDDIYPPQHADLHARIADQGLIVSESAPGYSATTKDFPRRNRLISGLARAVVVVEAEIRSGSLITARLAGEQGREVLAVPGSPLDPRAKGCNDLIRQGAAVCEGIDDVLRVLEGFHGFEAPPAPDFRPAPLSDREADALRERVAALLSPTPVSRDELIRASGAPAAHVLAALAELELAGRLEFTAGGAAASV